MEGATKKRSHHDISMEDELASKKVSFGGAGGGPDLGGDNFHLKLLIPSVAAGAIIGKGGETIAEIQKNVGARIKMSKANDFYPGTNERVCLITGSKDAILSISGFLVGKIKEKPDPNAVAAIDFDNKKPAERGEQIKVIVPNSTAGMIIGKGGSYVKELKESSGSFIQLSQKARDTTLPERVVTIIGEEMNNKIALEMVLDKILEDPQSGSCLNISYSDINGPVANFNPTGSPFANGQQQVAPGYEMMGSQQQDPVNSSNAGYMIKIPGHHSNLNIKLNFVSSVAPTDPRFTSQCLPHIHDNFRRAGYSDKVSDELTRAMEVLSFHGVVQLSPTMNAEPADHSWGSHMNPAPPHPANQQGPFGPSGLVPAPPGERANNYNVHRPGSPGGQPYGPVNNNSFGLATAGNPLPPPPGEEGMMGKIEIEVSESLVGAVLGPAGRSIVEIQQYSGTNIQISKKGVYSPGTRNRIVTVTGPQKSLSTAQFLIEQRVQELEMKKKKYS